MLTNKCILLCFRSISTISYLEEPGQDENSMRPLVRMENTFQLGPNQRFPDGVVRSILKDVLVQFLEEEKYEPELCREMTKTISEVSYLIWHVFNVFNPLILESSSKYCCLNLRYFWQKLWNIENDFTKYFEESCWLYFFNISPLNSFLIMLMSARFSQNCTADFGRCEH